MVVIAYPCGTGGNFLGSLISLMMTKQVNSIMPDGSVHSETNGYTLCHIRDTSSTIDALNAESGEFDKFVKSSASNIIIGHMRDIKHIIETYAASKVIYVTVDDVGIARQRDNFIKKIMLPQWSKQWFDVYFGGSPIEFKEDISEMPQSVIDEILEINLMYITEWSYRLPSNMQNVLKLSMAEQETPDLLVEKILNFLDLNLDESHLNDVRSFAKKYADVNQYINIEAGRAVTTPVS